MEADGKPERLETNGTEAVSFCPSFSSYSSDRWGQIAAKVTDERSRAAGEDLDDDDGFEFAFVRRDPEITEGEISCGGCEFREIYPVFNRDVIFPEDQGLEDDKTDFSTIKVPLKKLFEEEREERDPSSSSSSEEDELDRIPEGTYCVWRPSAVQASPGGCKKSNSTGSTSKRWNFRDLLLRRSNSEGKDSFLFLTPENKEPKVGRIEAVENSKQRRNSDGVFRAKGVAGGSEKTALAVENSKQKRNSAGNMKAKGVAGVSEKAASAVESSKQKRISDGNLMAKGVASVSVENPKQRRNSDGNLWAKRVTGGNNKAASAHEVFYVKNRASMEVDKRKSYLPYRQDLVGFFSRVNGVGTGKAFPPF